jgi:putative N6-adenine-specific DNA methylase
MTAAGDFEIFLVANPGLEGPLCAEARAKGFKAKSIPGGVTLKGGWPEVWRANLEIRGASRVLARIDTFRTQHLAQLDRRARHDLPLGRRGPADRAGDRRGARCADVRRG